MDKAIKANRGLFLIYSILLVISMLLLMLFEKGYFVIALNSWHQSTLDKVFVVITKMGEWYGFLIFASLIYYLTNFKTLLAFFISCLIMLIMVYILKNMVFTNFLRPSIILEAEHLHFVKGLYINKKFSFPSGHTTSAFTFTFFLALCLKKLNWKALALFLGLLIGLSRIYLAQHFLEDVVFGSLLGVGIASFGYFVILKKWLANWSN